MEIIVAYFVRNSDNAYTAARKTSPIDAIEGDRYDRCYRRG